MSGEKATSPCNKFQANIFNKSKCQNCFKSRELHLLTDRDMEQAKPIYADWLCLAPEGTDFDNPMQRSRKWQRRFFILYEHGSLSFALDELRSTLPQGTVDLNLCTDIVDAEPRTGQRNALCIVTPEQEIFIRGDNKEIINGWSEQLGVFLRTNRQNQKKKRKVEPVATQEPSPAKMAATDSSFPSSETSAESGCGRWQEDQQSRGPGGASMWTITDTDPPGPKRTPAGNTSPYLSPAAEESPISGGSFLSPVGSLDLVAGGNADAGSKNQPAESKSIQTSANNKNQSQNKSNGDPAEGLLGTDVSRTGRSETRSSKREKLQSCGDISQLAAPPPPRRARSLDRRTSDTVMTPDLLNFKKGWLVKLDENEQWKKYWFVLSTDSLRYYKDSMAEEASDLEGEIDLTKCFNVSEYQVQRNYGFQIHTPKGVYTLSAMTSGIRKNWIQALMKNVHPANAPDVASLPGHHGPCSPPEALPKPDVTQDSPPVDVSADPHPKHRTVMERRREGRYRTFDWAELRPQKSKPTLDPELQRTKAPGSLEMGDLERRKRREERRRRYESMLGISLGWGGAGDETADGEVRALSPKSQQKVAEEIEECWKLVEQTVFRLEKTGPLFPEAKDSAELEKLLDSYRTGVDDLKAQLAESERRRLELKAQLDSPLSPEQDFCPSDSNKKPLNGHTQTLTHSYREARELLQEQSIIRQGMQEQLSLDSPSLSPQAPRIWLHDTEGNFQELAETVATPLLSPASDSQDLFSDGETSTTKLQKELSRDDCQQVPASQTETNSEYRCLIMEKPAERDGTSQSCCVEHHIPPDQAIVRRLSQEVELLTSQNEALNQRNQEMVNQLTEADREIERLKVELSSRYTEPRHLPEVEQLGRAAGAADLERELSVRNQELLEAQSLITSLEENLRETEALLNLNAADQEKSKIAEKADECLLRYLEGKLAELERQLGQSEASYRELQIQNAELKEAEKVYRQTAEASIARLSQELEKVKEGGVSRCVSGEERIQEVIEGTATRLSALGKLLEVIDKLDVGSRKKEREENPVTSQLKWEEEFWSSLLNKLNSSQLREEEPVEVLLSEVTERMIVEKQMLLLGQELLSKTDEGTEGLDIILNTTCETETEKTDDKPMFDRLHQMKQFRAAAQMKMSSLNLLASSVRSSAQDDLQLLAERLSNLSERPRSGIIHSAATEALYCFHLSRLQSEYDKELEEAKQKLLTSSLICSSCVDLMEENTKLRATLSKLEEESSSGNKLNMQTEEIHSQDTEAQEVAGMGEENVQETPEEEKVESSEPDCTEIPLSCAERDENTEQNDASWKESDLSIKMEEVLELRRKVEELEEQLTVMEEQMEEELSEKLTSVQTLHKKEMEKLKVTFEHGFTSMEESHVKVVEELQRRHQQEVERLLVERDRLLEEESAATATAIGAIKNAHRLELEREVQRRCQTGNTHLEDVYRQHSEELTSYQRELQVLSQQFSLKCLENGHLVQALDAERKALCQCQQENQDLRTRNQELSGHLAAEITRLCSLAKQDALPLSQGMDVYEMEITMRVKETEVQCLKQEITSLKDELQAAQKDKRNATKKYKDIYTELSILRAKTERELDELRENLRLAHQALDSP